MFFDLRNLSNACIYVFILTRESELFESEMKMVIRLGEGVFGSDSAKKEKKKERHL